MPSHPCIEKSEPFTSSERGALVLDVVPPGPVTVVVDLVSVVTVAETV